jgi:hypothetical protein
MTTYAERFVGALTDKFADPEHREFLVVPGRKYDKIVVHDLHRCGGGQRHVHAFVERKTGALIKAAGWNAPQRDKDGLAVRYMLDTPEGLMEAIDAADQYGMYLYK